MTHVLFDRFLSANTLVRVAFAVLSLSAAIAPAANAASNDAQTRAGDSSGSPLMGGGN